MWRHVDCVSKFFQVQRGRVICFSDGQIVECLQLLIKMPIINACRSNVLENAEEECLEGAYNKFY